MKCLTDKESRIIELLIDVLHRVSEIYRIMVQEPHYREELRRQARERDIVLNLYGIEPSRQLDVIMGMNRETLSMLQNIQQKVDMSLKGVDPDPNCGGNLQLIVEGQKLKLICLKNTSHTWEIDGVRAV